LDNKFVGEIAEIDKKLGGIIFEIIKDGYYKTELGTTHVIYTYNKMSVKKIVLCGLGIKNEISAEKYIVRYHQR
jgi:hypothetical protein